MFLYHFSTLWIRSHSTSRLITFLSKLLQVEWISTIFHFLLSIFSIHVKFHMHRVCNQYKFEKARGNAREVY